MKTDYKKIVDETKRIVKKKDDAIRLLKTKLGEANGERIVTFKMPADITVGNFPDKQKVEITNHPEKMSVHVLNLKDFPKVEFPAVQKVFITNTEKVDSEKASSWVPSLVLLASQKLMGGIAKIIGGGVPVTLSADERKVPLTVVVVDPEGNPIDMRPPKGSAQSSPPGFPMVMHGNVTTIAQNCYSGRIVIVTPGQAIQLPNVGSKRVIFNALPSNAGTIAIGGKTVSAQSGFESGSLIYALGSAQIDVNQGNVLWVDGSNAGDVVTYNILS